MVVVVVVVVVMVMVMGIPVGPYMMGTGYSSPRKAVVVAQIVYNKGSISCLGGCDPLL